MTAEAATVPRRLRLRPIHVLPALLLAAGIGLRVLVLLGFRQAFLFYGDSYSYIDSAHQLKPPFVRPLGYSLFIRPLLHFHDLVVISAVQHAMGVAIAVLLYLVMRRLGLGVVLSSLAMAPVLLDSYQLVLEQYVLAETLLELLLVLALLALAWRPRPTAAACAAAGGLLALATLTRTAGILAIAPVLAYLVLRRVGWRRLAVTVFAFALPLLGYSAWFDSAYGRFDMSGMTGWFLYGRVGQFADCKGMSLPATERRLCQTQPPAGRPGPNFYLWAGASPAHHLQRQVVISTGGYFRGAPMRLYVNSILEDFAQRVLLHQPVAYLDVVAGDLWHYALPGHTHGIRDETPTMWQFRWQVRPFPTGRVGRQMYRVGGVPRPVQPEAGWLISYQRYAYTPGPVFALTLLLGLIGAGAGAAVAGARSVRLEAMLFALCGFSLPLIAAATSMFDYRYLLPAIVLLPPGGALGLHALGVRRRMLLPAPEPTPALAAGDPVS
ncbi:MAG TPA: hypothetical protein VMU66_07095 [Gaiellales bacterium]|nr:hypothetical protein [Gaiellales bacterium]